jgi:hypothetical protein
MQRFRGRKTPAIARQSNPPAEYSVNVLLRARTGPATAEVRRAPICRYPNNGISGGNRQVFEFFAVPRVQV